MGKGFFGSMFDFSRDGKLDAFERAADFMAFEQMMSDDDTDESDDLDFGDDELELNGLDRDELEFMDEDERREAMEDVGLDPDDFDF